MLSITASELQILKHNTLLLGRRRKHPNQKQNKHKSLSNLSINYQKIKERVKEFINSKRTSTKLKHNLSKGPKTQDNHRPKGALLSRPKDVARELKYKYRDPLKTQFLNQKYWRMRSSDSIRQTSNKSYFTNVDETTPEIET